TPDRAVLARDCQTGQAAACRELGLTLHNGRGEARNAAEAERVYQKACGAGDIPACFYLADLYTFAAFGVFENEGRKDAALAKARAAGCSPSDCVRGAFSLFTPFAPLPD